MPDLPQDPANMVQKNVEIRSEPVQEILTYVPHWLVHSGSTAVLVAVLFLLLGSYMIKYPDTIHAQMVLTMGEPPLRVFAKSSGKIERLFVADQDKVEEGQYLVALESAGNLDDILWLQTHFSEIEAFLREPQASSLNLKRDLRIGELQAVYSRFLSDLENYHYLVKENYPRALIEEIRSQIENYQALERRLVEKRDLNQEELQLSAKKYARSKQLFEKKLISEEQYNEAYASHLSKQQTFANSENSILNNRIQVADYRKTILELERAFTEKSREALVVLQENFKALESAFAAWELQFVMKAPSAGTVALHKFWAMNQHVVRDEEVLTIVPGQGGMIGKIDLPQSGFGKVAMDQVVHIRFESYPYKEYGMVIGRVASISPVTREDHYLVTVQLPQGLVTTYGKRLAYKFDMLGDAAIITQEMRLIQRIFSEFRFLWSSYT